MIGFRNNRYFVFKMSAIDRYRNNSEYEIRKTKRTLIASRRT